MVGPLTMDPFSVILLCLAGLYGSAMLWLLNGFRRACRESGRSPPLTAGEALPLVSVIVPARNEAANIIGCLESILANDYPRFEIIVVDDGSDDATAGLAESVAVENEARDQLRVVRLRDDPDTPATGHKKRAIQTGIHESRGDIVVTTDADSVVPVQWLSLLVARFSNGVDLVSAPVAYPDGPSLLNKALALEMVGLVAAGGGGIANGHPNMCNGANLAYRRQAFDGVDGFRSIDHLSSGDDTLLMLKIASRRPDSVHFCADPDATVVTRPAVGWRRLLDQRRRWASKGLDYDHHGVTALALIVYAFHAALLLVFLAAFHFTQLWPAVLVATTIKLAAEGLLLQNACSHFDRKSLMKSFLPAQLIQIPYVVIVGLLGVLGPGFSWKGRQLAR